MTTAAETPVPLASAEPPDPVFPARWRILGLLVLLSAGQQLQRIGLPAAGKEIMREYELDEVAMGGLYSVFLYTYTLMMTPGGLLADRIGTWGSLLVVMAGSTVFGALTSAMGWLGTSAVAVGWWIVVVRGGMGVLAAPLYPSTSRTVGNWFPRRERVLANSFVTGAALIGISGAYLIMRVLNESVGWRKSFLILGAVTAAITALWAIAGRTGPWGRGPAPRVDHPAAQRLGPPAGSRVKPAGPGVDAPAMPVRHRWSWLGLFRHRGILALTLSYATVGYYEYLFFYWLDYYFQEILKLDASVNAAYTMAPNLTMMVFTPLGGVACVWIVRRWGFGRGLRGMAMGSMALGAVFLVLGAVTSDLDAKIVWLSLGLGFIGASEGPFWTAAVHLGGPFGGATGGFVNTGGNLLGILAPIATPWIAKVVNESTWGQGAADPTLGWTVALIVGSLITLAGVLSWLWVDADRPLE